MPNKIKYSVVPEANSLRSGNFYLGVGDSAKGPSSSTGFYNGITPASGGYTVYLNKATPGAAIYCPPNDSELISLTNIISGQTFTTVTQCFLYYLYQFDKMVVNEDYPNTVTNGLVFASDAGFIASYPATGATWFDIGPSGTPYNPMRLVNGPGFTLNRINFDGVDDYAQFGGVSVTGTWANTPVNFATSTAFTAECIISIPYFTGQSLSRVHWLSGAGGNSMMIFRATSFFMFNEAGGANSLTINYTFPTSRVFHATVVRTTANVVSLYVNGALVGSGSRDGQFRWAILGSLSTTFPSNFSIFTNRIYNRALSAAEVEHNYFQGPIATTGLTGAWDAGNYVSWPGTGATVFDLTTASRSGVLVNGLSVNATNGGCLQFDGVDDVMTFTSVSFTDSPFTLEFWGSIDGPLNPSPNRRTIFCPNFGSTSFGEFTDNYVYFLTLNCDSSLTNINFGSASWPWKIPTNQVFHWAFSLDLGGTRNAVFYVNGQPNPTVTPVISGISLFTTITANFSRFGATPSVQRPYIGKVFNARIYSRVLTPTEVMNNYQAQKNRYV
jgi:hypothetical protein